MDIEKAKEKLKNPNKKNLIDVIRIFKRNGIENYCITEIETIKTVLSELEKKDTVSKKQYNHLKKSLKGQIKKKDKVIDLMAEQLGGLAIFDIEKEEPLILGDKEEVKQYFYKKAEEK